MSASRARWFRFQARLTRTVRAVRDGAGTSRVAR